jgi:hypothetical protein
MVPMVAFQGGHDPVVANGRQGAGGMSLGLEL